MLHRAAATITKMRATRFDPMIRTPVQLDNFGFVKSFAPASAFECDLLAGQRMEHPGRPVRDIGLTPPLAVEARDISGLFGT
jgi:hypothetical protein